MSGKNFWPVLFCRTMMLEFSKRASLAIQVADSMRAGIDNQLWKDFLPGERHLTQLFHVSRPTISEAVRILAKDGLIEIRHGCRTRIVRPGQRKPAVKSPLVAILTHEPVSLMASSSSNSIGEMRAHLSAHGFATEVYVCQGRTVAAQIRSLEMFIGQTGVFCCVLISLRRELQQWFEAHAIPALVLGSCHAQVRLPSFDVDYRAVCRHAAGVFRGKGHRRIALVIPDSGGAGEAASEMGFIEGAKTENEHDPVQAVVLRHDGTANNLSAKLDALFDSPRAPTALLVAKPLHVLIVVFYLLKRGLSVPDRISLISRDQDHVFISVNPAITHYRVVDETYNKRLTRLMLKLVNHGSLAAKAHVIFPRFYRGGTLRHIT